MLDFLFLICVSLLFYMLCLLTRQLLTPPKPRSFLKCDDQVYFILLTSNPSTQQRLAHSECLDGALGHNNHSLYILIPNYSCRYSTSSKSQADEVSTRISYSAMVKCEGLRASHKFESCFSHLLAVWPYINVKRKKNLQFIKGYMQKENCCWGTK